MIHFVKMVKSDDETQYIIQLYDDTTNTIVQRFVAVAEKNVNVKSSFELDGNQK